MLSPVVVGTLGTQPNSAAAAGDGLELVDADFPHERPKARIWAEGVEAGCRRDHHEPFVALLVGRLQPAQRLVVVPQTQVDKCAGESCVAGRATLERREDVLRLGALAGAPGYVP